MLLILIQKLLWRYLFLTCRTCLLEDSHPICCVTSDTAPPVSTTTSLTGTDWGIPVRSAVFIISCSWRESRELCKDPCYKLSMRRKTPFQALPLLMEPRPAHLALILGSPTPSCPSQPQDPGQGIPLAR